MFKRNRWTAFMMAGVMGVTTAISCLMPINTQGATYAKTDGSYRMLDGTSINGVMARGIDVSHWKGVIDWNAVAADDIQFVMLGTTYSGGVDPYFRANAEGAAKAGLNVGAYLYSYATDTQIASDEADFILDLIKDYPISYPVAFDAESSKMGELSPQEISNIINTFCKKIEDAGYYPMVYANDYWLANKIDLSQMKYDVWVARYEVKHTFANPVMWQATQTGSINGVNGNVDINFQYRDLSDKLPANRWRTIGEKTYYYQNHAMQRDTWIDDGSGWFYIDSDASAMKNWQKINDAYYYLDETNGRMASGWLAQQDKWYYLGSSGAMATGWRDVDGARYYLDENGVMQTGWYTAGDADYYLSPSSGKMTTGWRTIDGSWYHFSGDGHKQTGWYGEQDQNYYLNGDGKMATGWQNLDQSWYYFNQDGQRQAGVLELNGVMYYLDPATGVMAANTTLTLNDVNYNIDGSGACTQVVEEAAADVNDASGAPETSEGTQAPTGSEDSGNVSKKGPGEI